MTIEKSASLHTQINIPQAESGQFIVFLCELTGAGAH